MKRPLFALLLFIVLSSATSFRSVAQTDLYKKVKLGPFQTAFTDTLIYDKTQTYRAYGYDGAKPYFVKIWYPVKTPLAKQPFLSVKDIFTNKAGNELAKVDAQLQKQQNEIILRNYINKEGADPLVEIPNDCGCYKVLDRMMALKTKTVSIPLDQKLNYPVIVYHHGSQSNSIENFVMAEYFASNGFIFVSANFHLPYENTLFGLKPFDTMVKNEEDESLSTILSFARSITADTTVFFIGHSWGAQMGLRTLDGNTTIKGLVSLETTIEFKTDPKAIQEKWPEVHEKIVVQQTTYPYPILFCAATGKKEIFSFFDAVKTNRSVFVSTVQDFDHEAYLSLFYLSYFAGDNAKPDEKKSFEQQYGIYLTHLALIHSFFKNILKNVPLQQKTSVYIRK